MAERYYGLNLGETKKDVTEGSSSTATLDVEVRIDLAGVTGGSKGRLEAITMLKDIVRFIEEDTWPPA